MYLDYKLPQAIDAEKAVLGACLIEPEAYGEVKDMLKSEHFYSPANKCIYEAITAVYLNNQPIDIITVSTYVESAESTCEVTRGDILQLTRNIIGAWNIEHHAKIIVEKFYLREIIRVASEAKKMAYTGSDVDEVDTFLKKSFSDAEDVFSIADTGATFDRVVANTLKEIEKDCADARQNKIAGIPTGIKSLDQSIGGLKNGNSIILAARPGVGKTSLALSFALNAARAGKWVNFFSLEMNKEDLARIVLSAESGVYRSDIRDGRLSDEDWQKLNKSAGVARLPIVMQDAAGLSIEQIERSIKKNQKNGKCDFVVIDYLQLIKPTDSRAIREQQIAEISRTIKKIALAVKIPILTLSQLSRAADEGEPKLSHLRESGTIEQDADLVLFLNRERQPDTIQLTVAKHRRGKLGKSIIYSNSEMTRFSDYPYTNDDADTPF